MEYACCVGHQLPRVHHLISQRHQMYPTDFFKMDTHLVSGGPNKIPVNAQYSGFHRTFPQRRCSPNYYVVILGEQLRFSCCQILHVLYPPFLWSPYPCHSFISFLHFSFYIFFILLFSSALVSLLFMASSVFSLSLFSHSSLSFSQTVCLASLLSRRLLCLQAKSIACICVIRGRKLECLGVEWKVLF